MGQYSNLTEFAMSTLPFDSAAFLYTMVIYNLDSQLDWLDSGNVQKLRIVRFTEVNRYPSKDLRNKIGKLRTSSGKCSRKICSARALSVPGTVFAKFFDLRIASFQHKMLNDTRNIAQNNRNNNILIHHIHLATWSRLNRAASWIFTPEAPSLGNQQVIDLNDVKSTYWWSI